jgi:hypothetical protein
LGSRLQGGPEPEALAALQIRPWNQVDPAPHNGARPLPIGPLPIGLIRKLQFQGLAQHRFHRQGMAQGFDQLCAVYPGAQHNPTTFEPFTTAALHPPLAVVTFQGHGFFGMAD